MVTHCGKATPTLDDARDRILNDRFAQLSVDAVIAQMPANTRDAVRPDITRVMDHYVGIEEYVAPVLIQAAECGRFQSYVRRLEEHYEQHLQHFHPDSRADIRGEFRYSTRQLLREL